MGGDDAIFPGLLFCRPLLCQLCAVKFRLQVNERAKTDPGKFAEEYNPGVFVPIIYTARFRTQDDREKVSTCENAPPLLPSLYSSFSLQVSALWTSLHGSRYPLYVSTRLFDGNIVEIFCGRFSIDSKLDSDCCDDDEEEEEEKEGKEKKKEEEEEKKEEKEKEKKEKTEKSQGTSGDQLRVPPPGKGPEVNSCQVCVHLDFF